MAKAIGLAALLMLAACATPAAISDPRQVWCDQNEPRRDYHDGMSRAEVDKLNEHNRKGEVWCGWQAGPEG